jgi:tannase
MLLIQCALAAVVSLATAAQAVTLNDVCTTSYVRASLPADGFYMGITIDPASVSAIPQTNTRVSGQHMFPDAVFDYCNVTFAYSHAARNDQVLVNYWLPTPANFQNRYLSTGGGALAINSGTTTNGSLPGGVIYGAVSGLTDGGFGSFTNQLNTVLLLANGTLNWDAVYMFGYQAHHELSVIGKAFTREFFNMSADTKLFSYYQGCSEGGRQGWSQVQRFGDQFDGAITGAPAVRWTEQQVQHLYSSVVEQTLDYYPPPCEMAKIVNETIAACDALDGKVDGVVARTDLCKLHFNTHTTIGKSYYCAAASGSPAQSGTVTEKGVAVANQIIDGLHDLNGLRVFFSYQPTATFDDAVTVYNSETRAWEISLTGPGSLSGSEFVAGFLQLLDTFTLSNFGNVTYDTLAQWMNQGWHTYADSLETNWPDLTPFHNAGGKIIQFHGESDDQIPTASSVRYHQSVRQIMYPNLSFNASSEALGDWYRLFLVPGAGHCAPDALQPNGPFPQTNLAVLIDWVEHGATPVTLNATVLQGDNIGQNAQICAWPLRPYWPTSASEMECQYDQASIDSWLYDLDAIKMPVY